MTPYYDHDGVTLYHGSAERLPLADGTVQTCVTSPPYWGLRDYGIDGQIGLEPTPAEYVTRLVGVFREVRRVLRDDGTAWLNLGDSYASGEIGRHDLRDSTNPLTGKRKWNGTARQSMKRPEGIKPKDLVGIPWRVAFALQADGWYLRSDIIWHKPNPMPESVTDRPTKAHEYLFLLSKSADYYYDADAVREPLAETSIERGKYGHTCYAKGQFVGSPTDERHQNGKQIDRMADMWNPLGRNRRSVWTISVNSYPGAHFATFPPELITPCILAGSRPGDVVLDCFNGSGTTGEVARKYGRRYVGVELNADYLELTRERFRQGYLIPVEPRTA